MFASKHLLSFYSILALLALLTVLLSHRQQQRRLEQLRGLDSVHQFNVPNTLGQPVALSRYSGQVLLIVNIASRCGLTQTQYAGLAQLRAKFQARGLRILNFPCNQFGAQMPEADGPELLAHIRTTQLDIGELFAKLQVNGGKTAPLYKLLKRQRSDVNGGEIGWNFEKFLLDKRGFVRGRYEPSVEPLALVEHIEKLLREK